MARRALPVLLVLAAALADTATQHGLAVYLLLAAIPAVSVTALSTFGDLLDEGLARRRLSPLAIQTVLWALALALIVAAAAARPIAFGDGEVTAFGHSALVATLTVLCIESLVALGAGLRAPTLQRQRL